MTERQRMDAAERPHLSPALALVLALHYMADADRVYRAEEQSIGVWNVLQRRGLGNQSYEELMMQAGLYRASTPLETFVQEAAALLNRAQQECLLLNVADVALADSDLALEECTAFQQMLQAFGIAEEELEPSLAGVVRKYRLDVFE